MIFNIKQAKTRYFLRYWLPVIIWAAVIFALSSQPYHKQDLRPFIEKHIDQDQVHEKLQEVKVSYAGREVSVQTVGVSGFIEFFIRKGAHLTEYFILGFLVLRALYYTRFKRITVIIIGIIMVTFYAASDEYHQVFTANRSPHVEDVLLDSTGGIIGIFVALVFYYWKKNNLPSKVI